MGSRSCPLVTDGNPHTQTRGGEHRADTVTLAHSSSVTLTTAILSPFLLAHGQLLERLGSVNTVPNIGTNSKAVQALGEWLRGQRACYQLQLEFYPRTLLVQGESQVLIVVS